MRRGPLRHDWFAAFTAAVALGTTANEVSRLALPLLLLGVTRSLGDVAILNAVQFAPYVLFGGFAGVFIDRSDKRRLLIGADITSIALTVAIPISVWTGMFSIPLVYAIAFLLGAVEVLRGLATDFNLVPALVGRDELTQANAIYLSAARAARIVGPIIGGFAIQALGPTDAFWIAALAFVPTAAVLLRMPRHILATEPHDRAPLRPGTVAREIGEGFAFVWRVPVLRALASCVTIMNLAGTGLETLVIYTLAVERGMSPGAIGLAYGGIGVAGILGSVAAPAFSRFLRLGPCVIALQALISLAWLLVGVASELWAILAMLALRQFAIAAWIVYIYIPRQAEIPLVIRGRANGAFRTVVVAGDTASPPLLSLVQAGLGTPLTFVVGGVVGLVAAGLSLATVLRTYSGRAPVADDAVDAEADVLPGDATHTRT